MRRSKIDYHCFSTIRTTSFDRNIQRSNKLSDGFEVLLFFFLYQHYFGDDEEPQMSLEDNPRSICASSNFRNHPICTSFPKCSSIFLQNTMSSSIRKKVRNVRAVMSNDTTFKSAYSSRFSLCTGYCLCSTSVVVVRSWLGTTHVKRMHARESFRIHRPTTSRHPCLPLCYYCLSRQCRQK